MVKLCKRGPKLDHQIRLAAEHDKGIPEVRTRRKEVLLSVKGTKAQKKIGYLVSIFTILVCSFILLYIYVLIVVLWLFRSLIFLSIIVIRVYTYKLRFYIPIVDTYF